MRLRAVLLLAFSALLCAVAPHRLAADPRTSALAVGVITPVPAGDLHCPAATNALFTCGGGVPPSAYLLLEKTNNGQDNLCRYATVYGDEDLTTCPGYTLIRVTKVAKPLFPPLPCTPVDCTPPQ
jgi:hypothetical protein